MSTYSGLFGVTLTFPGTRTVEGATISDPFAVTLDTEKYSTATPTLQLVRKAISLTNGQSVTIDPGTFTMPLGDAGSVSFVQAWFLQNTGESPVSGTLQMQFGNGEYVEAQPGGFVTGGMPLRAATQAGWDSSTNFVVSCSGGSGATTGILVLAGNPSA